ncbi:hypothetical protein C5167_012302 [Papaver somniferum]|uniref:peptidylprolyl isomerase n=1 Tax=Papaver somniferum TaxID=3469 RepID=A0A4Y7J113_PAPSO|nr:hypothetical protein C5167_012302 [Papaver somniferum]
MSFWGVEIKPAKPFTLPQGKIQITQRSLVQCNVGDKSPVLICTLLPDTTKSLGLNLQFDEEDEVTFLVLGPQSVHLTGFYLGSGSAEGERDDDDSYPLAHEFMDKTIDDDEKPANRKGNRRYLENSDVDDEEFVIKDQARCKAPENEDEDTVSISYIINKKGTTDSKEEANCNFKIQLAKESAVILADDKN